MQSVLRKLDLSEDNPGVFHGEWCGSGAKIDKISPIDGKKIASFRTASPEEYETAIARAHEAFQTVASPQTAASAAFHDQTATGKLKALITAITPSGCHCSIKR